MFFSCYISFNATNFNIFFERCTSFPLSIIKEKTLHPPYWTSRLSSRLAPGLRWPRWWSWPWWWSWFRGLNTPPSLSQMITCNNLHLNFHSPMTMAKHANMSKMVSVTNLSTYNVFLFKESCDLVTREQWEKKNAEFEVGGGDRDTFAEQWSSSP